MYDLDSAFKVIKDKVLTSNLFMMKPKGDEPGPDIVLNFFELIHSLLKDPEARQEFFKVTFCMYIWKTHHLLLNYY